MELLNVSENEVINCIAVDYFGRRVAVGLGRSNKIEVAAAVDEAAIKSGDTLATLDLNSCPIFLSWGSGAATNSLLALTTTGQATLFDGSRRFQPRVLGDDVDACCMAGAEAVLCRGDTMTLGAKTSHTGHVREVAKVANFGEVIATCAFDSRVRIFNLDLTLVAEYKHSSPRVVALAVGPGGHIVSADAKGQVLVAHIVGGKVEIMKELRIEGAVDLAFQPSGSVFAVAAADGTSYISLEDE